MTNHSNNNTLPFEILKMIFQNLLIEKSPAKKDLKTCSSVCKSWKVVAQEVFGKISIEVSEDSLKRLSRDIGFFGQKVKSIDLKQSKREDLDRTFTRFVWLDIIFACPNLVSIKISLKDDSDYVRCLMEITTERLGHIQSFETTTPDLHLQLNLKYCESITSSSIIITSLNPFPGRREDNTLVNFISRFPKLASFCLNGLYKNTSIDLIYFLEAAPQLQELFIHHFDEVKSSSKAISDNLCLTVLRLKVRKMDINSLIFITTRLKKLNKLELRINDLVPKKIFGIREIYGAKKLLDDLKIYTSGISEFIIKYKYENVIYKLVNGTEPKILSYKDIHSEDSDDSDDDDNQYFHHDNDSFNDNWFRPTSHESEIENFFLSMLR